MNYTPKSWLVSIDFNETKKVMNRVGFRMLYKSPTSVTSCEPAHNLGWLFYLIALRS